MGIFRRRCEDPESDRGNRIWSGPDGEDLKVLEPGCAYWVGYRCRDIGYGIEEGHAEFVYRGGPDWTGKHEFAPVGGGPTIYLFPDEIEEAWQ